MLDKQPRLPVPDLRQILDRDHSTLSEKMFEIDLGEHGLQFPGIEEVKTYFWGTFGNKGIIRIG